MHSNIDEIWESLDLDDDELVQDADGYFVGRVCQVCGEAADHYDRDFGFYCFNHAEDI